MVLIFLLFVLFFQPNILQFFSAKFLSLVYDLNLCHSHLVSCIFQSALFLPTLNRHSSTTTFL